MSVSGVFMFFHSITSSQANADPFILFWSNCFESPPFRLTWTSLTQSADFLFFSFYYFFLTPLRCFLPLSLMDWCQDNIKAVVIPWHDVPEVLLTFSILKQGKCLLGRCTWGQAFSVCLMSGNGALTSLCTVNGCHQFCWIHLQHSLLMLHSAFTS